MFSLLIGLIPYLVSNPESRITNAAPPGLVVFKAYKDANGKWWGEPIAEPGPVSISKVKLNTSPKEWLLECPGIGSVTADLIVRERKKALFSDWEDFRKRISGMGPAKILIMKDAGVTLGP